MKVLYPVHIYLPGHRAGVELYTAQLAANPPVDGEARVATTRKIISRPSGFLDRSTIEGVPVYEAVNNLSFASRDETWLNPVMEDAFTRILDDYRPDVVHFQHLMYWSAGLPRLAREKGARVLMTLHDFWLMCARMGQLVDPGGELCAQAERYRCGACMDATPWGQSPSAQTWIKRLIAIRRATGVALDGPMRWAASRSGKNRKDQNEPSEFDGSRCSEEGGAAFDRRRRAFLDMAEHVDLFLTPSQDLRARLVDWGAPEDRFVHLAQGRDASRFEGCTPRSFDGTLRFGFIGTVAPHKGVLELVRAAKRLRGSWSLDVLGPSAQHPEYWESIKQEAADHAAITLHGPVSPEHLPRIFDGLDALCVPSLWNECCPLTIQEAFMAGVPVLASDLGGMRELVEDGIGGLRVRCGDEMHWTEKMQSLVDSPTQLQRLRESIPRVPGLREHLDKLHRLYRDA